MDAQCVHSRIDKKCKIVIVLTQISIDEHAINIAIMGAVVYATDTLRFKSVGTPLHLKIFVVFSFPVFMYFYLLIYNASHVMLSAFYLISNDFFLLPFSLLCCEDDWC